MIIKTPISALTLPSAVVWLICALAGVFMTFSDAPVVAEAGKLMLAMSAGYMLFGLGLDWKRIDCAKTPADAGKPN